MGCWIECSETVEESLSSRSGEAICSFHKFWSDILWTAHMWTCSILKFPSFILYTFSDMPLKPPRIELQVICCYIRWSMRISTFHHCNRFRRSADDWGMNFYTRQSTDIIKNENLCMISLWNSKFVIVRVLVDFIAHQGIATRWYKFQRHKNIFIATFKNEIFQIEIWDMPECELNIKKIHNEHVSRNSKLEWILTKFIHFAIRCVVMTRVEQDGIFMIKRRCFFFVWLSFEYFLFFFSFPRYHYF